MNQKEIDVTTTHANIDHSEGREGEHRDGEHRDTEHLHLVATVQYREMKDNGRVLRCTATIRMLALDRRHLKSVLRNLRDLYTILNYEAHGCISSRRCPIGAPVGVPVRAGETAKAA